MTVQSKQEAFDLFEEHRKEWLKAARKVAIELAQKDPQGLCTIDAVRAHCPVPEGVDPKVCGAVFKGEKGRWEFFTLARSSRKEAHGRPVTVWQLQAVTPREKVHTLLAEDVGQVTGV